MAVFWGRGMSLPERRKKSVLKTGATDGARVSKVISLDCPDKFYPLASARSTTIFPRAGLITRGARWRIFILMCCQQTICPRLLRPGSGCQASLPGPGSDSFRQMRVFCGLGLTIF